MSDLNKFVETALAEPVLFVVGSGISIPFPSCLPSAKDMIDLTLDVVAPEAARLGEKEAVASGLPELFYESLYQVAGNHAVSPWQLLKPDIYPPNLLKHELRPNIGHLIVVYLAWRQGLPIITTNFDLFFEQAAHKLDLIPVVSHPDTVGGFSLASERETEVAIWKLHGSVDSPSSICTTLQRISRYDKALVDRLRCLFVRYQSCLLAYSGRDIDLFPFIASYMERIDRLPYWICLEFGQEHGIHSCPDRFQRIEGQTSQVAEALIRRLPENTRQACLLKRENVGNTSSDDVELQYDCERVSSAIKEFGAELIADKLVNFLQVPGKRQLAFGIALAKVDRYSAAKIYLQRALSLLPGKGRTDRIRAHLLLSSCEHNLSKYEKAEAHAVQAGAIASAAGYDHQRLASLAERDEALRMQYLPRLGVEDWRNLVQVGAYWTGLRFVVDSVRLYRGWKRAATAAESERITLANSLAEHLIRLISLIQGGLKLFPAGSAIFQPILVRAWRRLRSFSHSVGYAAGVGNVQKYLDRFANRYSSPTEHRRTPNEDYAYEILSARKVFGFIAHDHAIALLERDQAERHREEGDNVRASRAYRRCIQRSRRISNRSLELKGHIGLASLNLPVDCVRVRDLITEIEGASYRARAPRILDYTGCGDHEA